MAAPVLLEGVCGQSNGDEHRPPDEYAHHQSL
jgi:hypothetical protein